MRIYENRHGEHSKIVLIDDEWVAFGSYNFEHAAHDRLAEAMLVSRDARATRPAAEIFAELRRHPDNLLVTPQVARRLPGAAQGPALAAWPIQAVDVATAHSRDQSSATSDELRFKEIEHKFVVDEQFDLARFRRQLAALGPARTSTVAVRDRYFLTEGGRARASCSGIGSTPSSIT